MQLAEESRYDVIVLTASLPIYQPRFERALRPGGRLFVVVGASDAAAGRAWCAASAPATGSSESLFETCIEALEHAPRPPRSASSHGGAGDSHRRNSSAASMPASRCGCSMCASPGSARSRSLPGSINIPLGEMPARWQELDRRCRSSS